MPAGEETYPERDGPIERHVSPLKNDVFTCLAPAVVQQSTARAATIAVWRCMRWIMAEPGARPGYRDFLSYAMYLPPTVTCNWPFTTSYSVRMLLLLSRTTTRRLPFQKIASTWPSFLESEPSRL